LISTVVELPTARQRLLLNGYADACGLSKARPLVDAWQNQFDPTICQLLAIGIPSQMLKTCRLRRAVRLGVLGKRIRLPETDMGADTVLLWNEAIFKEFAPGAHQSACAKGYLRLNEPERAILWGLSSSRPTRTARMPNWRTSPPIQRCVIMRMDYKQPGRSEFLMPP
jgi:hypothetical protein